MDLKIFGVCLICVSSGLRLAKLLACKVTKYYTAMH